MIDCTFADDQLEFRAGGMFEGVIGVSEWGGCTRIDGLLLLRRSRAIAFRRRREDTEQIWCEHWNDAQEDSQGAYNILINRDDQKGQTLDLMNFVRRK